MHRFAFNNVWIQGSLGEKVSAIDLFGLCFKDFNEGATDNFALLFRVFDSLQLAQE